jgi:ElaB/YqjD/DUF883 family membrane-anchored ribosome-binding protein
MGEIARALKRFLGPRLTRFDIARMKREAEARAQAWAAQAAADAIRRARERLEDFLEELRRRMEEEDEARRRRRRGTVTAWRGVAVIASGRVRLTVQVSLAPSRPTRRRGSSRHHRHG